MVLKKAKSLENISKVYIFEVQRQIFFILVKY